MNSPSNLPPAAWHTTDASAAESQTRIRVGFNTRHGMADEQYAFPPPGVEYSFPEPIRKQHRFIRSPMKCYLWQFELPEHDLIEALLTPIITKNRWICSLDCFQAAVAYNLLGAPVPRQLRVQYVQHLLLQENCKRVIFWSQAALKTLTDYGGVTNRELLKKCTVVYPAIREVPESSIRFSREKIRLLFSGDFFRKGGVNVLDAFEAIQTKYPHATLRVCSDEKIDFNTPNDALRRETLARIARNSRITFGRVSRDVLVKHILPETDIFLLPTYNEAFGFAILEAMAFGIPVIATSHFAIPEIIEHGQSGFLIALDGFDENRICRGYTVNDIPSDFRKHVTDSLTEHLCRLIESPPLREQIGLAGADAVRSKFSFGQRNRQILDIYADAVR